MDIVEQIFNSHIGKVSKIQPLDSSDGTLYLVESLGKKYALELYRSGDFLQFSEIKSLIYANLAKSPYVAKKTIEGVKNNMKFCISEYHGDTFLTFLNAIAPLDRPIVANHLLDFFECCRQFQFDGYGDIQEDWTGKSLKWSDVLYNSLNEILLRIQKLESQASKKMLSHFHLLSEFLAKNIELFEITDSSLVLEGLSIDNIVLDDANVPQIIYLNKFVAGDIYFALGELIAQMYGTWLCRMLLSKWPSITARDMLRVRFYSFLTNLKISLNHLESDPQKNNEIIYEKMDLYKQFLDEDCGAVSAIDLFNCELFSNEDFGIKLNPYISVRTIASQQTLKDRKNKRGWPPSTWEGANPAWRNHIVFQVSLSKKVYDRSFKWNLQYKRLNFR